METAFLLFYLSLNETGKEQAFFKRTVEMGFERNVPRVLGIFQGWELHLQLNQSIF